MLRAKVFPPVDFFYAFLQTRGMLLVEDKPNILHYTGDSEKELLDVMQDDKPDLTISHQREFPKAFLKTDRFWVWHPVRNEKELFATKRLITNSHRMCQTYYQRLGLQAEIQIFQPNRPKEERSELKFVPGLGSLRRTWQKICQFMYWA